MLILTNSGKCFLEAQGRLKDGHLCTGIIASLSRLASGHDVQLPLPQSNMDLQESLVCIGLQNLVPHSSTCSSSTLYSYTDLWIILTSSPGQRMVQTQTPCSQSVSKDKICAQLVGIQILSLAAEFGQEHTTPTIGDPKSPDPERCEEVRIRSMESSI